MALKEYFGAKDLLLLCQLIYTELNKYVLAVQGKQLSTEDFTTVLKTKLEDINLSDYMPKSGGTFTGVVNVPTATAGTDSTQAASTAFVTAAINSAISGITGIQFDGPYNSLAALQETHPTGTVGIIYLVNNSGSDPNSKDEYFWDSTGSKYELFGTTSIDLSNYLQKTDVDEMTTSDVQAVWDSVFGS